MSVRLHTVRTPQSRPPSINTEVGPVISVLFVQYQHKINILKDTKTSIFKHFVECPSPEKEI